ncbi:arginine--tRNA ligase [Lacibacterium aquatile]|uniref:Arginine--tRNA ligase n=1 Tax=Lacibacterium aquatile TaxID=1168082 RepID=A0ABW5DSU5_9PROT
MTTPKHLFKRFHAAVLAAVSSLIAEGKLPQGLDASRAVVEPPRDASHGDISTNVAMVTAKAAGMKPRDIAELVSAKLQENKDLGIVGASVDGPGFLNFRLTNDAWLGELATALKMGTDFGRSDDGAGHTINVEYVSANPTGPMHVGHCRGAVVGDVLANLLDKAGYDVIREYYINDAGAQVDVLARSAFLRYREALGETIEIPPGLYPGEYLKPVGQALAEKYGQSLHNKEEADWLPEVRAFAIDAMMAMIRQDLADLGVKHDLFYSERSLVDAGMVDEALKELESKGLIYVGVLEPPKGKTPDDWEPRPQTLFKASEFGDDVDRPLKKSDGSWTYFANDIAYHLEKTKARAGYASPSTLINIWGADHGGYVKRMNAAVKALTGGTKSLDVKLCQLVNLMDNGQPVKMSKRAGTFVTLADVVEEVGKDVVRFIMLTRKNDASLDFDYAKVREQSKDNPVWYVQYAHARTSSVLKKAADTFSQQSLDFAELAKSHLNLLTDDEEIALIRLLASWPRLIEAAAEAHEPHRVAFYLYDVAASYNALQQKGKSDMTMRFIQDDAPDVSRARLALVAGVKTVIASGLAVLGVEPVEEMR